MLGRLSFTQRINNLVKLNNNLVKLNNNLVKLNVFIPASVLISTPISIQSGPFLQTRHLHQFLYKIIKIRLFCNNDECNRSNIIERV